MTDLDLTDPMVRAMADRDHEPEERWTLAGRLLRLSCRTCAQPWPCATRVALRVQPCTCLPAGKIVYASGGGRSFARTRNPFCPVHGGDR